MNAEKVAVSVMLLLLVTASIVAAVSVVVLGFNSGTLGTILGPVLAVALLYATYKFCGFVCRNLFHKKKAS